MLNGTDEFNKIKECASEADRRRLAQQLHARLRDEDMRRKLRNIRLISDVERLGERAASLRQLTDRLRLIKRQYEVLSAHLSDDSPADQSQAAELSTSQALHQSDRTAGEAAHQQAIMQPGTGGGDVSAGGAALVEGYYDPRLAARGWLASSDLWGAPAPGLAWDGPGRGAESRSALLRARIATSLTRRPPPAPPGGSAHNYGPATSAPPGGSAHNYGPAAPAPPGRGSVHYGVSGSGDREFRRSHGYPQGHNFLRVEDYSRNHHGDQHWDQDPSRDGVRPPDHAQDHARDRGPEDRAAAAADRSGPARDHSAGADRSGPGADRSTVMQDRSWSEYSLSAPGRRRPAPAAWDGTLDGVASRWGTLERPPDAEAAVQRRLLTDRQADERAGYHAPAERQSLHRQDSRPEHHRAGGSLHSGHETLSRGSYDREQTDDREEGYPRRGSEIEGQYRGREEGARDERYSRGYQDQESRQRQEGTQYREQEGRHQRHDVPGSGYREVESGHHDRAERSPSLQSSERSSPSRRTGGAERPESLAGGQEQERRQESGSQQERSRDWEAAETGRQEPRERRGSSAPGGPAERPAPDQEPSRRRQEPEPRSQEQERGRAPEPARRQVSVASVDVHQEQERTRRQGHATPDRKASVTSVISQKEVPVPAARLSEVPTPAASATYRAVDTRRDSQVSAQTTVKKASKKKNMDWLLDPDPQPQDSGIGGGIGGSTGVTSDVAASGAGIKETDKHGNDAGAAAAAGAGQSSARHSAPAAARSSSSESSPRQRPAAAAAAAAPAPAPQAAAPVKLRLDSGSDSYHLSADLGGDDSDDDFWN